jgi:hypothetical protein
LLPPDWPLFVLPPPDWPPEPPEREAPEPVVVADEPFDFWLFTVADEPLVVSRLRTLVRDDSLERTLARICTLPPPLWLRTTVRLLSPLIATLGCRFFMITVRRDGSDSTNLTLFFFLITTLEGSCPTATT